ncbi:FMN-binding negative transcriptional regulator [Camelimonas sp. ID_303_24]
MYTPPAFRQDDPAWAHQFIRATRLGTLVTATAEGMAATPLPMLLDAPEGREATLLGHLSRANDQWKRPPVGEALVIFTGPDAYVTPSWYPSKQEAGKVVPTWNYQAVHVYGEAIFFDDPEELRAVVTRLTDLHEAEQIAAGQVEAAQDSVGPAEAGPQPWRVSDAPEAFIAGQLRGIVGVRLRITRICAKSKMSQNRSAEDQAGVVAGLSASRRPSDRAVAAIVAGDA